MTTNPNARIDALMHELANAGHPPADIGALFIAAGTRFLEGQYGRAVADAALVETIDTLRDTPAMHGAPQ
jgi:hypothetical protein